MKRKAFRDKYPWKRSETVSKTEDAVEESEDAFNDKDTMEARFEEDEARTLPNKRNENFINIVKKEKVYKPRKLSFAAQSIQARNSEHKEEETGQETPSPNRRFPQKFTITGKRIKISLKKPMTRKLCMKMTAYGETHRRNRFIPYRMYSDKKEDSKEQGQCFDTYNKAKKQKQRSCKGAKKKEC